MSIKCAASSEATRSHSDASSGLAQVLPQLIDRLTPTGQVPANHNDMLTQALSMLTKRTG